LIVDKQKIENPAPFLEFLELLFTSLPESAKDFNLPKTSNCSEMEFQTRRSI